MKPVLSVALLLATAQGLASQEEEIKKALAGCAALGIETARLDCFEQLARAVARFPFELPEPRVSQFKDSAGPGKWKVDVSTSPIDDSRTVALRLVDGTDSMQIALLCHQGRPQAYVTAAKDLEADQRDLTLVSTRVGEAKAESKRWPVSMNHRAAVYPGGAGPFIGKLLTVERLVVQVKPVGEDPITAVFELGELPDVVAPLKEACRLP